MEDQIRLLELYPGREEANIHARLRHYAIDSAPAYTAISYRWRSKNPLRAIHLDEMRFFARENLVNLLQCLRDPHQSRMLWIDAICVNQSDNEERSSQVQKMGLIYSRAETVISWLDLQGEGTLRRASDLLSAPSLWRYIDFRKGRENSHESWEALQQVMTHEYWTRTWIIQEIITAERVMVQSGLFAMPLSLLEDFA
ncbi:hypothetical protein LTR20_006002 [Exophiala xenobiotica]|nr:hypothetical protein LTS06_011955 [Exophiala xenobiotica]KAK5382364.1 hypothetical protein LTS13_003028 [Exophiala xenobiotica]KAK5462053.1 hypothetical protein LTR20_006002 [Exophiala xenobiotica]KAK5509233.1 hypothetical protein LTR21_007422 [Exophiala xenobiotica]KAK5521703.1 hypothetical protein LTR07_003986 [Exophiala xenobiotica]